MYMTFNSATQALDLAIQHSRSLSCLSGQSVIYADGLIGITTYDSGLATTLAPPGMKASVS